MLRRGEASGSSVWCAPDSLLEGDGFELPVPGRIYSAAMRSQGDLPVFLAFAGQARRRNEDHARWCFGYGAGTEPFTTDTSAASSALSSRAARASVSADAASPIRRYSDGVLQSDHGGFQLPRRDVLIGFLDGGGRLFGVCGGEGDDAYGGRESDRAPRTTAWSLVHCLSFLARPARR